jgi:hypothetical protein
MVVLALCGGVGCKRMKTGALEHFSAKYSCPADRITVRERDDIKGSQVNPPYQESPPDEVKKDPARLAVWEKTQRDKNAELYAILDNKDVFEVRGCEHAVFLACWRYTDQTGNGGSGVSCDEGKITPP